MKHSLSMIATATVLTLGVGLPSGSLQAAPITGQGAGAAVQSQSMIDQVQYRWAGREYCWYEDGWHGTGWYWCGYRLRRGLGWGGPAGWHGWRYGGEIRERRGRLGIEERGIERRGRVGVEERGRVGTEGRAIGERGIERRGRVGVEERGRVSTEGRATGERGGRVGVEARGRGGVEGGTTGRSERSGGANIQGGEARRSGGAPTGGFGNTTK